MGLVYFGQKFIISDLNSEMWQQRFADPQTLAEMIRERGISFVELPLYEHSNLDELLELSALMKREGLFVTLHPYFDQELAPEIFSEDKKIDLDHIISTVQEIGNITAVPVQCVFHGGKANMEPWFIPYEIAVENAQKFFKWLDEIVTSAYENVVPLCETQMPVSAGNRGQQRLGDTWNSAIELVHDTSIGICWDFGHTFQSSYLGKHKPVPEENFLARVEHVHAHDAVLTDHGIEDHIPLGSNLVSWREYCAELARHNYNETILIEVYPNRYGSLNDFLDGVQSSVNLLKEYF